jgi:ABC-type phosphate transport system substrate-binding protein
MLADRLRGKRGAAALAATAIVGLFAFGPSQAAQATSYEQISGSGSTYAAGALDQWATDLVPQGLQINYSPVGSAMGRDQYIQGENDFAGSDIAFISSGDPDPFAGSDPPTDFAYSYIPDVAGGLAFIYNLQADGHRITNLRLRPQTLAEIFTGHITNWDNPAITHDYGAQLPNLPITVVTRSDGAGESYFLSRWMWKMYPSLWSGFCHAQGGQGSCGPTEDYPGQNAGFKALNGAEGVAGYVAASANNGAIGYAETYYALNYHIPIVSVANPGGYYVQPTGSNVAIALEKAQIDENQHDVTFLMQNLDNVYTDPDPRAYPLSAYSYLIVPRDKRTIGGVTYGPLSGAIADHDAKGVSLSTYINFILCGAQASAVYLGYSPLPGPMVTGGFLQDSQIPGAVPSPAAHNYATCNNPAFYDGKDVLTATAPYPPACQKVTAPLNASCAASESKTADSGSTTSGSKTSDSGRNSRSNNAGTNPNTGQALDPTSSNTPVNAQPVGLASRPEAQWLFGTLAGVVLLAAICVPVLLGTWLQRRRTPAAPFPGGGTEDGTLRR